MPELFMPCRPGRKTNVVYTGTSSSRRSVRSERYLQLASRPEGSCVYLRSSTHSAAEECAASLTGIRDDGLIFFRYSPTDRRGHNL